MREYSFDSGDEEFVPRDTSEPMKREKNINFLDTTDDSADEFDLRGQIHMKGKSENCKLFSFLGVKNSCTI